MAEASKVGIPADDNAPEGGWGWVVAMGMATMFVVTVGPMGSFGLIFGAFMDDLGEGTKGVTVVTSIFFTSCSFTGLITNYSLKTYSCREVGVVGGFLFFFGNVLTVFSTSVVYMSVTFGLIPGIGMGLMVPAAFSSFNAYFQRRRAFVMSIAQVVIGALLAIFPLLAQILVDEYGFRGAQAILTGISLHAVLAMAVLRPITKKTITALNVQLNDFTQKNGEVDDVIWRNVKTDDITMSNDVLDIIKIDGEQNDISKRISLIDDTTKTSGVLRSSEEDEKEEIERNNLLQRSKNNEAGIEKLKNESIEGCSSTISQTEFQVSKVLKRETANETSHVDVDIDKCTDENEIVTPLLTEHGEINDNGKTQFNDNYPLVNASALFSNKTVDSNPRPSITSTESALLFNSPRDKKNDSNIVGNEKKSNNQVIIDFLDLTLFKDPVYVSIVLGMSLAFFADVTFFTIHPLVLFGLGFSKSDTALCMSVGAAGDLVGRLFLVVLGLLWPTLNSRALFFFGSLFSIISRLVFISFNNFMALCIITGVTGFFRSWVMVTVPLVFAEYTSLERFPSAYGLYMVVNGAIAIIVGPLIGYIRDVTNSFPISVHSINLSAMICIVLWTVEAVAQRLRSNKKNKQIE